MRWLGVSLLGLVLLGCDDGSSELAEPVLPTIYDGQGYVGSEACASCHTTQHSSWAASYHATMTQVASPDSVLAPWDGVDLESAGRLFELSREGDAFWVELDDPDGDGRVRRRMVLTTGSHYEQRYWVEGSEGVRLDMLPIAYLATEQRWVNDRDLFLTTDQAERRLRVGSWNSNCIKCHSTGGQPRTDSDPVQTRVGELTISCETCHGPGKQHVSDPRSPLVDPRELDHVRASQVCGQCHASFSTRSWSQWKLSGPEYRPGDSLDVDRRVVQYFADATEGWMESWLAGDPSAMETKFWDDGTVLPGGREYNGLAASRCFTQGKLSCMTCHSGHSYADADKMVLPGKHGDAACVECHPTLANAGHTHHADDSIGGACMSCHMPRTTWGMLRAVPSHRIDSPSAAILANAGRPNACNLCHLDKTVAWTAERLGEWYGTPAPELETRQREIAAGVLWMLNGHAVQRGVVAYSAGTPEATQTAGTDWSTPILAQLLADPVSAVRFTAYRALRIRPEAVDLQFEFDDSPKEREQARDLVVHNWVAPGRTDPATLLTPSGFDQATVDELIRTQDDRPIRVGE